MKIDKVGIELEGLWIDPPSHINVYGDGSVYFNDRDEDQDSDNNVQIGEINCKPLELHEAIRFIDTSYPDDMNKSCGYHIHLSFKDELAYAQLMEKKFYDYFLTKMEEFGHENKINADSQFWARLRGENTFCKKRFLALKQVKLKYKDEDRYAHLNYCYNLRSRDPNTGIEKPRKTLECRLFPVFHKKDLAIKGLIRFCEIVETYLATQKPDKPKIINAINITYDQSDKAEMVI